jgi:rhodanese-related sulfurtransferase
MSRFAAILAKLLGRSARRSTPAFAWIEVSDLCERQRGGDAPVVIDVRGRDEFTGELGHVKGASNIPLDALPRRIAELGPPDGRDVVLVCKTQMRSASAAALLHDAGFRRLGVLRGGMVEWSRQGLPVEHGPATPHSQSGST